MGDSVLSKHVILSFLEGLVIIASFIDGWVIVDGSFFGIAKHSVVVCGSHEAGTFSFMLSKAKGESAVVGGSGDWSVEFLQPPTSLQKSFVGLNMAVQCCDWHLTLHPSFFRNFLFWIFF